MAWPTKQAELIACQAQLAAARPDPYSFAPDAVVGGCFICFGRGGSGPGAAGDQGWAATAVESGREWSTSVAVGEAGSGYAPGLLALREGRLLEAAVRALPALPDVLFVNATGRDHPRRAGLALHLGAVLGIPTVGVTHRPLLARGEWPGDAPGAAAPLLLGGFPVGHWVRTRPGARPLAVHAAWRTDPEVAVEVVISACRGNRTPEPVRRARQAARVARFRATAAEDHGAAFPRGSRRL
jgi:deoxyribonuclease V